MMDIVGTPRLPCVEDSSMRLECICTSFDSADLGGATSSAASHRPPIEHAVRAIGGLHSSEAFGSSDQLGPHHQASRARANTSFVDSAVISCPTERWTFRCLSC